MSSIWSKNEIIKFYDNVISCDRSDRPLNAVDFFCVAARKKYMTEEQKKFTNLGDTCMMQKTVLKESDFVKFYSKIQQVDATLDYMLDRDSNYLPRSCMTFYMNVNHTDIFKSIKQFKHLLADWDYDMYSFANGTSAKKAKEISKQFKTIQNNLLKSFQDPINNMKGWIDIDCDIDIAEEDSYKKERCAKLVKETLSQIFRDKADSNNIILPYIIETHGGIHILVHSSSISMYNKYLSKIFTGKQLANNVMKVETIIKDVESILQSNDVSIKELKVNQNAAVPIPGTLQGEFKVKIY